jgi:hypothetical protein
MASLLDPRFKTGLGLSEEDKSFLWHEKEEMFILAAVEQNIKQQVQQPQHQEM